MAAEMKKREMLYHVPRYIAIISQRLNMWFQPNSGSSFYRRPSKTRVVEEQKSWNSPVGTLRLSDHWNYENYQGRRVYLTDVNLPEKTWALGINTGIIEAPWKILQIFKKESRKNIIRNVDFGLIKSEVKRLLPIKEV